MKTPTLLQRIVPIWSTGIFARAFFAGLFCAPVLATAQTTQIAVDGSLSWMASSHEITSTGSGKSLTIGISNRGGGFINKLVIPVGTDGASIVGP